MSQRRLAGVSVVVAGAGLAGLSAAHDLRLDGARVRVIDARGRIGGRVWTIREPFAHRQHAEAGGDLIDEAQSEIRRLAEDLGLRLVPILRDGFGAIRRRSQGPPQIVARRATFGWGRLQAALGDLIHRYRLAEQRWDSPIATVLAGQSVRDWLDANRADQELRTTVRGLRGFFLAEPEALSLLALVDQFAADIQPADGLTFRIDGGNDRLVAALARTVADRIELETELVRVVRRRGEVEVRLRQGRRVVDAVCDYLVLTLPATTLRRIPIRPALPLPQRRALARLRYGAATKTLLQFGRRFWRAPGRPRAFGSDLPIGAMWEANEEQGGRSGILALLAGGNASAAVQAVTAMGGIAAVAAALAWLGSHGVEQLGFHQSVWEDDPWAGGGYAYFDPAFNPADRAWLARPTGRVFFAGEHTSFRWQGYMNGAVESGRRAAAEVAAVHAGA